MKNLFTDVTIDEATGELIIREIAKETGIDYSVITGKTRPKEVAIARLTAVYIIRINNPYMTYENIGKLFGYKNHTSVMHAMTVIPDEYQTNRKFKENLRRICNNIKPDLLDILDEIGKKEKDEKGKNKRLQIAKMFDNISKQHSLAK